MICTLKCASFIFKAKIFFKCFNAYHFDTETIVFLETIHHSSITKIYKYWVSSFGSPNMTSALNELETFLKITFMWILFRPSRDISRNLTSSPSNYAGKILEKNIQIIRIVLNIFIGIYHSKYFFKFFIVSKIYCNRRKTGESFNMNSVLWIASPLQRYLFISSSSSRLLIRKKEQELSPIPKRPVRVSDLKETYNSLNINKCVSVYYFTTRENPKKKDSEENVENMEGDKETDFYVADDEVKEDETQNLDGEVTQNEAETQIKSFINGFESENVTNSSVDLSTVSKVAVWINAPSHKTKRRCDDDDESPTKRLKQNVPNDMQKTPNSAEPEPPPGLSEMQDSLISRSDMHSSELLTEQENDAKTNNKWVATAGENGFGSCTTIDNPVSPKIDLAEDASCKFQLFWVRYFTDFQAQVKNQMKPPNPEVEKTQTDDRKSPWGVSEDVTQCYSSPQSAENMKPKKYLQEKYKNAGLGCSEEIPYRDLSYKPYPGLAENPSNVKKDARYQKCFYRRKERRAAQESSSTDYKMRSHSMMQDTMQLQPTSEIASSENNRFDIAEDVVVVESGYIDVVSVDNDVYDKNVSASVSGDIICVRPRKRPFTELELDIAKFNSTYCVNVVFYNEFYTPDTDENTTVIYVRNILADHTASKIPLLPLFRVISTVNCEMKEFSMEEFLRHLRVHQEKYYSDVYFDSGFDPVQMLISIQVVPIKSDRHWEMNDDNEIDEGINRDCSSEEEMTSPKNSVVKHATQSDGLESGVSKPENFASGGGKNPSLIYRISSKMQERSLSEVNIQHPRSIAREVYDETNEEDEISMYNSEPNIIGSKRRMKLENERPKSRATFHETTSATKDEMFSLDKKEFSSAMFEDNYQDSFSTPRNFHNDAQKTLDSSKSLIWDQLSSLQTFSLDEITKADKENSSPSTSKTHQNDHFIHTERSEKILKTTKAPTIIRLSETGHPEQKTDSGKSPPNLDSKEKEESLNSEEETSLGKLSDSISDLSLYED